MIDLGGDYSARRISEGEYRQACAQLEGQIFGGNWLYDFGPAAKTPPPLGETFAWGFYAGEELIGWQFSNQTDERTVYMADSGLLPAHQGKGLYTRLLPHVLDTFRAAGYTLVQSHHRATNNRVITPKLRAGFVIQGMNLYEGGMNAALTLSLDPAYAHAQHVRSGLERPRGEGARRLGVPETVSPTSEPVPDLPLPATSGPPADLGGGYALHPVSYQTYLEIYAQLEHHAYATPSYTWGRAAPLPPVSTPRYAWLIAHGGTVAGWQLSRQWDARTAYMVNTALLPAHRGHGVYSRLLPHVLAALRAQGYDLVRSHHHATNNAVILPKLRAGFLLQGLQVDEHGVMAVLMHSFDSVYREALDIRSGLRRPGGEAGRRLGLGE